MSMPYYADTPQRTPSSPGALEAQHQREMIRIHEMWQKTKGELSEARAELGRRDNYIGAGGERDKAMQQLQALVVELRDKSRFTELQLAGAREESAKFSAGCEELRRQLSDAQGQLVGLQAQTHQQSPVIAELQAMVERGNHEKQALVEQLHQEQRRLEQTISNKEHTMQLQEQKLSSVSDELRRSLDAHTSSSAAAENASSRIAELERTNGELGRQLMSAKEQLKYLHLNRRSEAQVQALLHQLQLDNARLVKLLSSTEEYKEFVAYSEDSGGITYVPPPSYVPPPPSMKGTRFAEEAGMLQPVRERTVRGAGSEMEHWVPSDAYALANDFRRQHMPGMSMEIFAELLLRLNRVWRAREAKRLERQKDKALKKINELRRRSAQQVPYEEVLQSSEVERLRRELKEMRTAFNTGRRKLNDTEERLLESSIESAATIESQLYQQTRQNESLLAELAEVDLRAHSAYGEGVSAASATATDVSDRFAERLTELMREFQRKTLHINRSDADLYMRMLQLQSWFLESLDRRLVQCREKMAGVYEVTLAAKANQQQALVAADDLNKGPMPAGGMGMATTTPGRPASAPPYGGFGGGDAGTNGTNGASANSASANGASTYSSSARTPRPSAASYVGLVDGGDSDDFDD